MIPHVRYCLAVALAVATCAPLMKAQQAFETAAIHRSHETPGCSNILPPVSNHFELTCVPLRAMVELAFRPDELDGNDKALDTMYDVRATTPAETRWTLESVEPLLRTFLVERFHLVSHVQTKTVPGFDLVVGARGSRLRAASVEVSENKNSLPLQSISEGRIEGRGIDADAIASLLGIAKHKPIVNRTGLSGRYDIDLHFAPEDGTVSDQPEFTTAVKEQLGLELKPTSVPIQVMVVDHVDADPSDN